MIRSKSLSRQYLGHEGKRHWAALGDLGAGVYTVSALLHSEVTRPSGSGAVGFGSALVLPGPVEAVFEPACLEYGQARSRRQTAAFP